MQTHQPVDPSPAGRPHAVWSLGSLQLWTTITGGMQRKKSTRQRGSLCSITTPEGAQHVLVGHSWHFLSSLALLSRQLPALNPNCLQCNCQATPYPCAYGDRCNLNLEAG